MSERARESEDPAMCSCVIFLQREEVRRDSICVLPLPPTG